MFLSWNGHRAILLLVVTQNLVFASMDDEEKKTDSLYKLIVKRLQVPWIKGIDWLSHSPESTEVNELKAWIQATESGERWAVQMLANMSERQREIRSQMIHDIRISGQCADFDSHHKGTSIWSYRNMNFVAKDSVPSRESTSSACNASLYKEGLAVPCACQTRVRSKDFTTGEIATVFFFSTIAAFMIVCTICDFVRRRRPRSASTTINTLAKFSLYTNALALLSTKVSSETMPALHGIRCLSCCSIMIGHHYLILPYLFRDFANVLDILEYKKSWTAVYAYAALFSVDTFLVISGMLTSYLFLKSMKSGKKFNFFTIYLYRYVRLTPCLAVIMLFVATLFHRAGNGIIWESSIDQAVDTCRKNWWINLLYIQNLTTKFGGCLLQAWYLGLDMQLFWMSPIILYPLYRWPKFGLGILSLFFVVSVATPTVQFAVNGYSHAVIRFDLDTTRQFEIVNSYYMSTINRASPYLIGILLGYDIATKKRRLTQVNVAINWAVAAGLVLYCVWGNYQANTSDFAYDLKMETAFAFLSHPAWSITVAWMIFACTQGYGGIATRFLSLPFFIPLSRLSYCIYLVHLSIQGITITTSIPFNIFWGSEMLISIISELVLSIIFAFVLSLFIESPVIVLIKILLNRGKQREGATLVQEQREVAKAITKYQ